MPSLKSSKRTFLHDAVDFAAMGSHVMEGDDFSRCFVTKSPDKMKSSGFLYMFSFITRYFILFPLRIIFLISSFGFLCTAILYGYYVSNTEIISKSVFYSNKILVLAFNAKIKHKGEKRRFNTPHVYVSNHTSFIDYIVLSSHKFAHACIAEQHGGLFGFIFKNFLSKNGSIGFKRSEKKERESVVRRMKEHVIGENTPMLVFPEGTCVNNEYLVLFQKGVFDMDVTICPVSIRYKKDISDPYWNRRIAGFTSHLFYFLTRWRLEAEVHWLEPVKIREGESSISFSHRVRDIIRRHSGLKNTLWNGYFKSSPVMKDRELLRTAFKSTYRNVVSDNLKANEEMDLENGLEFLRSIDIDCDSYKKGFYFGKILYKEFINECCKEYLRLKIHSPKKIDLLLNQNVNKN